MEKKDGQQSVQRMEVILRPFEDDVSFFKRYAYILKHWKLLLAVLLAGLILGGALLYIKIKSINKDAGPISSLSELAVPADRSYAQMRLTVLHTVGGLGERDAQAQQPSQIITEKLLEKSAEALGVSIDAGKLLEGMTVNFEIPIQTNAYTWRVRFDRIVSAGIQVDKAPAYLRMLAYQIDQKLIAESDNRRAFYFDTGTLFAGQDELIALNDIEQKAMDAYMERVSCAFVQIKGYVDEAMKQLSSHIDEGIILSEEALSFPQLIQDKERARTVAEELQAAARRGKAYWMRRFEEELAMVPKRDVSDDVIAGLREASVRDELYISFLEGVDASTGTADKQALKLKEDIQLHTQQTFALANALNKSIDVYYETVYFNGLSRADEYVAETPAASVDSSTGPEGISIKIKLVYLLSPALLLMFVAVIFIIVKEHVKGNKESCEGGNKAIGEDEKDV